MKSNLYSVFLLLLFVLGMNSYAQDCERDIRALYAKSAALSYENGYYAQYAVQTQYKDKDISRQEVVFTVVANQNQIHVTSDKVSTYADKVHLISVSHLAKSIIITNSSDALFKQMSTQSTQYSDSALWMGFKIVSCKPVEGQKMYNQEVVLQAKNEKASVKEIVYYYQKGATALYRVCTKYNKSSELETLNYTFYKVDTSYKCSELRGKNVYSLFFDAKGKLLPAYKNYEIIDQRNSQKNK